MNLLKKAAISLAATSMIAAPVAASAQTAVDGARATSTVKGKSDIAGSGWIIALIGAAAIIGGIIIASDNNNDESTSP